MPRDVDPLKLLFKRQGNKSITEFADEIGVTQGYLSLLYAGKRIPGKRIMRFLRLKRIITKSVSYQRIP